MKNITLFLLLIALPVSAQPDCQRTIDSLQTRLHIAEAELREADHVSSILAAMQQPHEEKRVATKGISAMLPFFTVGAHGMSHTEAAMFGGFGIEMIFGNFGLSASANMERLRSPLDTTLKAPAIWQPVFYGSLQLFLY